MSQSQSFMGLAVTQEKSGNMIIDKPLNAYQTCKKYYPELLEIVSERMKEIGI